MGHVRYSTTGEPALRNVQPFCRSFRRQFCGAHNGNLTNALKLRNELVLSGAIFQSSDTEVLLQLIARSKSNGVINRVDALKEIDGAMHWLH